MVFALRHGILKVLLVPINKNTAKEKEEKKKKLLGTFLTKVTVCSVFLKTA